MSLSEVQRRVAAIVLSLPEAAGFALAGGAALIVHGVIDRDTRDLDCFGASAVDVDRLVPAAVAALSASGFAVESQEQQVGFARLRVTSDLGGTLLDVGFDPASLEPTLTDLGAVRAVADLAGDKLLALFSRAAPRDFVDVAALSSRFSRDDLLRLASDKDAGFNSEVLAEAFNVLPAIRRDRFDVDDASYDALRMLFASWRRDIINADG